MQPDNQPLHRTLALAYGRLGDLLANYVNNPKESIAMHQKALAVEETLLARDPRNTDVRRLQGWDTLRVGEEKLEQSDAARRRGRLRNRAEGIPSLVGRGSVQRAVSRGRCRRLGAPGRVAPGCRQRERCCRRVAECAGRNRWIQQRRAARHRRARGEGNEPVPAWAGLTRLSRQAARESRIGGRPSPGISAACRRSQRPAGEADCRERRPSEKPNGRSCAARQN